MIKIIRLIFRCAAAWNVFPGLLATNISLRCSFGWISKFVGYKYFAAMQLWMDFRICWHQIFRCAATLDGFPDLLATKFHLTENSGRAASIFVEMIIIRKTKAPEGRNIKEFNLKR